MAILGACVCNDIRLTSETFNMDFGTSVVRGAELLESTWTQIQALCTALSTLTDTALKHNEFKGLRSAGAAKTKYQWSASGTSATSMAVSVPVTSKKRGNGKPTAWINYQVSVFDSGIPPLPEGHAGSIGPVLHVSFWHLMSDLNNPEMCVGFPPAWGTWELRNDRLLSWAGLTPEEPAQWTFSLRLLGLNGEDALRNCVIQPIQALLAGIDPADALPATLPGLVFYDDVETESAWTLVARA